MEQDAVPTILQKLADTHDAERHAITLAGMRAARGIMRDTLGGVLRSFELGDDPRHPLTYHLARLIPIVRDAMITAHLRGYRRSFLTAGPKLLREPSRVAMSVYQSTIDILQRRTEFTEQDISEMRNKYGAAAFDQIAAITGILDKRLSAAILDINTQGMIRTDAVAALRQVMIESGLNPSASTVEAIFRTQSAIAYGVGQQEANSDPALDEVIWGQQWFTVGDDRVRDNHAEMDGVCMPKGDPIWDLWSVPAGWNCRCTLLPVFYGSSYAVENPPIGDPQPDEGFEGGFFDLFGEAA